MMVKTKTKVKSPPTELPTSLKAPKNIPIESMLELAHKGLTDEQVASIIGCDRSNVSRRLQPYRDKLAVLDKHKQYRADILCLKGMSMLENITPAKLKKASARDLTTNYGILFDKERLERGQATSHVAYMDITKGLQEIEKEIQAIEGVVVD